MQKFGVFDANGDHFPFIAIANNGKTMPEK
jgi:hypothetical protein